MIYLLPNIEELANYQQMLKEQYEKHLYALTTQLLIREELDLTWRGIHHIQI